MAKILLSNTFTLNLVLVVSSFICAIASDVNYIDQFCYDDEGTYDIFAASDFPTNRDEALDQLSTLASSSYYATKISGSGQSKVFAYFACRFDISSDICEQCVTNAAKQAKIWCPINVEAIVFYQECTLHYANRTILADGEDAPMEYVFSTQSVNDISQFSPVLDSTVSSLITKVVLGSSSNSSNRYFATTEADLDSDTLSVLAQCNPDITSFDCKDCLKNAFGNFSVNHTGVGIGQVYTPSCLLTYKLSSFHATLPQSPFSFPSPDDSVPQTPSTFPSPDDNVAESPFNFPPPGNTVPQTPFAFPAASTGSSMYGSIVANIFFLTISFFLFN